MRIAWYSNPPFTSSGYGVQTKMILPRLRDAGHEVACIANCGLQYGQLNYGGIPVYPASHRGFDAEMIAGQVKDHNADCVVSFFDAWTLKGDAFGVPWVPWYPVDREPGLSANLKSALETATYRIAISKFGARLASEAGLETDYAPCMVDTEVFAIQERNVAREALGIPSDVFLFLIVADNKSNPSRKALQQQIGAFAKFAASHPDARLMLHTCMDQSRGGVPVAEYIEFLGIKEKVLCTDQTQYHQGLPESFMANAYNAADALLAVSMDEGFGVPIIEAQACGTPVIVGGWTAMEELCGSGVSIPREGAEPVFSNGGIQWSPRVDAIVDAMTYAYERFRGIDRRLTRAFADRYSVDRVMEKHLLPALARAEAKIKGEVPIAANG